MSVTKTHNNPSSVVLHVLVQRIKDYAALSKVRLNLTVVFSALLGYLFAPAAFVTAPKLLLLALGGFLITASSNTINQILEKDVDALMNRTRNRPLPQKRLSVMEAALFAGITGVVGILLLWWQFNQLAALLGAVCLIVYAFVYTPLKRVSQIAVFVGAIPGALPPVIGWVCATGALAFDAALLFAVQFLWQFPHFWAIAWVAFDDYKKAGFRLLPGGEKSVNMPIQSLFYIITLIPVCGIPFLFRIIGLPAFLGCTLAAILFAVPAALMILKREDKYAKQLMFASFLYLPIVLTLLVFG